MRKRAEDAARIHQRPQNSDRTARPGGIRRPSNSFNCPASESRAASPGPASRILRVSDAQDCTVLTMTDFRQAIKTLFDSDLQSATGVVRNLTESLPRRKPKNGIAFRRRAQYDRRITLQLDFDVFIFH
jgi:hypothetical protein